MNNFFLRPKLVYPIAVPASRPCPATAGGCGGRAPTPTPAPGPAAPCSILVGPEAEEERPGLIDAGARARSYAMATELPGRGAPHRPEVSTILLADDHVVVRQSLKRLLNQQAGLQLVGESGNGLETLSLVKQLQPDLLITDLMMPGMNGLEVTRRVRLSYPGTRVVVVSSNGDEPYVAGALRCGAVGFVLKSVCVRHLIPAVLAALAGRRFVSPPLSDPLA